MDSVPELHKTFPPTHKTQKTMARSKPRAGVGAKCSVLFKKLHPSKYVAEKFPNMGAQDRLEDLIATRREHFIDKGKRITRTFFTHADHPGTEFSSSYLIVREEGDPSELFETPSAPTAAAAADAPQDVAEPIDQTVFEATNTAEDIAMVLNQGLDVDDDNAPAPENVPTTNGPTTDTDGLYDGQRWGWDGLDPRRTSGVQDHAPKFTGDWDPKGTSTYEMFKKLFPWNWFHATCFMKTNEALTDQNLKPITLGEFIRFFGLILLINTGAGFKQDDFWSPYDEKKNPSVPYNLNRYMSKTHFKVIQRELRFTDRDKPTYVDRFWEVRQMIAEWNKNMAEVFSSSWVICLDKSMSIWMSRWTCPGWVFCPRKPHPFGNEYHSA